MHLNGKFSEKLIFLKTVEALVIILTLYVDLSAKSLILESHQYIKTQFSHKPLA